MVDYWLHSSGFQNFVSHAELEDLTYKGCRYTWTNDTICSKLDRALVNKHWLKAELQSYAEFTAPECLSNHSACLESILDGGIRIQKPFKFFNTWAQHDSYTAGRDKMDGI